MPQGYMLSPLLFTVVFEHVLRNIITSARKGIEKALEDLNFEDFCLEDTTILDSESWVGWA